MIWYKVKRLKRSYLENNFVGPSVNMILRVELSAPWFKSLKIWQILFMLQVDFSFLFLSKLNFSTSWFVRTYETNSFDLLFWHIRTVLLIPNLACFCWVQCKKRSNSIVLAKKVCAHILDLLIFLVYLVKNSFIFCLSLIHGIHKRRIEH